MPFTPAQIQAASYASIDWYVKNDPVDQINRERPLYSMFVENKQESGGGINAVYEITISNDSNYQNYYGADQVSYNDKDTLRQAKYPWYDNHDGFTCNEDQLLANGIILNDSNYDGSGNGGAGGVQASNAEKVQLANILKVRFKALKDGMQEQFDYEMHLNGAQNAKAVPGLDALVSTTPQVGVVGAIDPSTANYWRNNTNLSISTATPGNLLAQMEITRRACMLFGGKPPNKILASGAFIDAYARDVRLQPGQTIYQAGPAKGGVALDGARAGCYFHGIEIEWDPTMDVLDAMFGTQPIPWAKRCYFLNTATLFLSPIEDNWMVVRKPPRVYDRYAFFWALTNKYRLVCTKRSQQAVLSIA